MPMTKSRFSVSGSFRDPGGCLFEAGGLLYRQVNLTDRENYDCLMNSGLYEALVSAGLLIPHSEAGVSSPAGEVAYKVIKPEVIPFISYPYEWCFGQLKQAALVTLRIQKLALKFGMVLKDASAFNIQFLNGRPVLIDTLSFIKYLPAEPWVPYGQFCRHFLAPLALMSCVDPRLNQLSHGYLDGIPLDLASSLLPARSRFLPGPLIHLYCHSKFQNHYEAKVSHARPSRLSRLALEAFIDNLESAVTGMKGRFRPSRWLKYYSENNYSQEGLMEKKEIVRGFLQKYSPAFIYDIGANTGIFSRIAGCRNIQVVAFDSDHSVVEQNYELCQKERLGSVLPLVVDIANPSPAMGWALKERASFFERARADAVFALAILHHLVITSGIPLEKIGDLFGEICQCALVEFVPKSDPQAQRLLMHREDIFLGYTKKNFEQAFGRYFMIEDIRPIAGSQRVMYSLRKKQG